MRGGQPRDRRRQRQSQAGTAVRRRPERHWRHQPAASSARARPARAPDSRRTADSPGSTSGPTTPVPSTTPAYRCGVPARRASLGGGGIGRVGAEAVPRSDDHQGETGLAPAAGTGTGTARGGRSGAALCRTSSPGRLVPPLADGIGRSPPGATSHGSTCRRPAHRPGPRPRRQREATSAPTRPAPRTCTRMRPAGGQPRARRPAPGARPTESARSGRSRSRLRPLAQRVAAGPPPSRRRAARPRQPVHQPVDLSVRQAHAAAASSRSSGARACRRAARGSCAVAVSTGPSSHRVRGCHPELHGLPVPPGPPQRGLHHRMHIASPVDPVVPASRLLPNDVSMRLPCRGRAESYPQAVGIRRSNAEPAWSGIDCPNRPGGGTSARASG